MWEITCILNCPSPNNEITYKSRYRSIAYIKYLYAKLFYDWVELEYVEMEVK